MMLNVILAIAVLRGPFPLLNTPWTEEAKLDVPVLVREAEYVDGCGTGGIIWPTAPEIKDLDAAGEYEAGLTALAERAVRPGAAFTARLTATCAGTNEAAGVALAAKVEAIAKRTGAKMAILARPPDNATNQTMIAAYYRALAKVTTQPVIIQTYNGKSPQPDVSLLVELAKEFPEVYGYVKEESPGDKVNDRMAELLKHPEIKGVFSGWGGKGWIYQGARIGTCGVISQRPAYASLFVKVWNRIAAGADASDPELADAYAKYLYMVNLGDIFSKWGDDEMRGPHLYTLQRLGIFRNMLSREGPGKVKEWPMTDQMKAEIDARLDYCGLKARTGRAVENFNGGWEFSFDRANWKAVELPHDWAIEGPFDAEKGEAGSGKLPWKGVGYYRKSIVLKEVPKGRRLFLEFDGVMCDGTVFVNGQTCAHRTYGYLGMTADATPYLCVGTNTVVVRADTTKLKSRWYPGAGIYRRVRKIETDDIYLAPEDVYISTPVVSDQRATIRAHVGVTNRRLAEQSPNVVVEVFSPDGKSVGRSPRCPVRLSGGDKGEVVISVDVAKPQLWRMEDDARLYTTVVTVASEDGRAKDSLSFKTGFRTFAFDAEKGFSLNGERVQLKGVCLHSDLGILGMAFNKSAMRRQLRILKDMGVNALRTSHNPPAPELLDLCDEMGVFVWDECFDKWNETCGRGEEPLEEFVESNLRDFVRRDRNHPCVFVWSIGNEIPSRGGFAPGQETWNIPHTICTTAERCARFREAVLSEDNETPRPVGIGSCFPEAIGRGDYANLDITGWNYRELYNDMKKAYPDKPLIYSESASAFSEYGYYADRLPTNKTDYAVGDISIDSYDRNSAAWSDIPDREFERMERDRYVAGEFVWTGMDYIGEPSPYDGRNVNGRRIAPADRARSAYFGIFDLLCHPKDRAYLYRSYWNKNAFTLHIVPDHWTFPKRVGQKLPVYVYTSADEAELFVNGVSQGRRRKDPKASMAGGYYAGLPRYRLMWDDVIYQPGEVKAVAYGKDGQALGEEILRTAGAAAAVVLEPESDTLPDDGEELVFVKVTLADAKGTPVPGDNRWIGFAISGPAEIVSVGNGNPRGHDSFKATASHPLFNGRAGLVLRRTGKGPVTLTASADGLTSAVVSMK